MTASIVFGDNDSVLSNFTLSTDKTLNIINSDTVGKIINKLGTDTNATSFEVLNSSSVSLFKVDGSGGFTGMNISNLDDINTTGIANDKILKYNSTNSKWEI